MGQVPKSIAPVRPPSRDSFLVLGWRLHLATLLALGLTALAYSRSFSGEFQFDDLASIEENRVIRDLGVFLRQHLFEISRPVTNLTFAVNFALSELDVRAYHLTSILLHLATILLVFAFSRRVLRRLDWPSGDWLSLWVAGLFGLHPIQTQAVSYLSQRAEVLASLFYLLALLLMLEAEERGLRTPGGIASYAGALFAFAMGLGSKQIVVTFPATYLLLAAYFPRAEEGKGHRWGTRLALVTPFAALAGIAAHAVLSTADPAFGVGFELPSLTAGRYLLTQFGVLVRYLGLLVWPTGQNLDYAFPLSNGLGDPLTSSSGVLLVALVCAALALLRWSTGDHASPARRAARLGSFGIVWFFVVLSPTSSVVPVIDVIEEHRVYLAAWGGLVALGAALSVSYTHLAGTCGRARWGGGALGFAVWVALAALTYERNAVWESKLSLWRDVVAKSPTKARAHENLGHALYLAGDRRAAAQEYSLALRYGRDGSASYPKLLNNVGASLLEFGRLPEAIAFFREALTIAPYDSRLLNNLAIAYLRSGNLDNAESTARASVMRWPRDPGAHQALGLILDQRGDTAGALREFGLAAVLNPDLALETYNAALSQERAGLVSRACKSWRRYLTMRPGAENEARARQHMATLGCGG